jgi:hypothetical protein
MIPGRFKSSYSSPFAARNKIIVGILAWYTFMPLRFRRTTFGRYFESEAYIHFLDLFTKTKEVDPFDDSRLRYVVRIYKYDEKRKQIVPTRATASTTLRGAKVLARNYSQATGLPYLQSPWDEKEYITIYGYRAYVDYEKAWWRAQTRKRSGG